MSAESPPCRVLLLDTRYGITAVDGRFNAWWWTFGSGACDCNRGHAFGLPLPGRGHCIGCERFLIVACSDPEYTLEELNPCYPEKLTAEFLRERAGWTNILQQKEE